MPEFPAARVEYLDVCKEFGGRVAASNVSFTIEPHEFIAVLGPSGSGKTTMLRMTGGQESPDSGDIRLDGRSIAGLPPNKINAATVFQDFALFPHYTVEQNVGFGLRMRGWKQEQIHERVGEMLDLVGLSGFERRTIAGLSGGEKQRVATARALAVRPPLVLMDEPLGSLDRLIKLRMQRELADLVHEVGLTTLYVTHDQREALTMADRVAVLNNGNLEQIGTALDVCHRPATRFVAEFLGAAGNLLPAKIRGVDGGRVAVDVLGTVLDVPSDPDGRQLKKGKEAIVVARPEEISLTTEVAGQVRGQITNVDYTGELSEYMVDVGGQSLLVKALGRPRHQSGAPVGLILNEPAVLGAR